MFAFWFWLIFLIFAKCICNSKGSISIHCIFKMPSCWLLGSRSVFFDSVLRFHSSYLKNCIIKIADAELKHVCSLFSFSRFFENYTWCLTLQSQFTFQARLLFLFEWQQVFVCVYASVTWKYEDICLTVLFLLFNWYLDDIKQATAIWQ